MFPHERSLVKRLKDKPFALLGINSDPDKDRLEMRMAAEDITWRSFWCGLAGTRGKIPSQWGIRGWPTIYVLDHRGVIRYRGVKGERMDKAVDTLLAELEDKKPKQKRRRL